MFYEVNLYIGTKRNNKMKKIIKIFKLTLPSPFFRVDPSFHGKNRR